MVYDRHLRSALRDERNTSGRRFTIANPREGPLLRVWNRLTQESRDHWPDRCHIPGARCRRWDWQSARGSSSKVLIEPEIFCRIGSC
jgi:hypothetical protein